MGQPSFSERLDAEMEPEVTFDHDVGDIGRPNWLMSYADIVTLLLVFFILFFSLSEDGNHEHNRLSPILASVLSTFRSNAIDAGERGGGAYDSVETAGSDLRMEGAVNSSLKHGLPPVPLEWESIHSQLSSMAEASVLAEKDYLYIDFADGGFFTSGSYVLTESGRSTITRLFELLSPYMDNIYLAIQGHSDPTPVGDHRRRFHTNLELSALRAMAAYELLANLGMRSKSMSIAGFADQKSHVNTENEPGREGLHRAAALARDRRVSFRLEAR